MIEPSDLASILKREFEAADDYHEELSELQHQAFRYYEAQPFGNEVQGRSQIVLPDVQEVTDYMTQSVLRTMVSGDRTVEFEASDDTDDIAAEEATAAIDYLFMRKQDGYRILHDIAFDGLLKKIGIAKTCMETREKVVREQVIVDPLQLEMLEGAEVEDMADNGDGTVTATVKTVRMERVSCDYAVPTHEFRFNPRARHEDEADYLAHVREVPRSDLVEMGFDPDQVAMLPKHSAIIDRQHEYESRLDRNGFNEEASSPELELILLCEEYARIDVDGDGIAERVKCFRVENEILTWAEGEQAIETVEEQPFSVFCPFPRGHKLVGYSLADKVMDIQYQRSYVGRQMFDGLAFANLPRPYVDMSQTTDDTINDLLNPIPGGPVRGKGPSAVTNLQTNFDVGKSMAVLEWITGERESRTGITRMNQGLDADALNKTATGTALMQAMGQQYEEFVARNFAEAFARLCMKKYRLLRSEGEPFRMKVDGEFKTIDPSQWPEEVNVRVRVGLGTNSKDKRVQARFALASPLQAAIDAGFADHQHAFKWMDGVARDSGIGQGSDFMYDPSDPEVRQRMAAKEQQPDPEVEAKQAELAAKSQEKAAELQLREAEAQSKLQLMAREHELKAELEDRKQQREMALAEYKFDREIDLAERKAAFEVQFKADVTDQHMGGSGAA